MVYKIRKKPAVPEHVKEGDLQSASEVADGTAGSLPSQAQIERAMATIAENERRLAMALEAGDLGAWDLDLVNDTSVRSLRHDQIFGYDELLEEWGKKRFLGHVLPDDRPSVEAAFERAMKTGHLSFDARIKRADGQLAWIHGEGRLVPEESGKPTRMLGVVRDITSQKTQEETLRRNQALLMEAQRLARLGNWEWDPSTNLMMWSEQMFEIHGYSHEEVVPTMGLMLQHVHPEDRQWFDQVIRKCQTKGEERTIKYRIVRRDHEIRTVTCHGSTKKGYDGVGRRVYGAVQDITESERAAEAQRVAVEHESQILRLRQVNEFKTRLLNMTSHELNTPLTPILLQLHLLADEKKGPLTPDQKEALQIVDRNINRMAQLVRNILDVGRIESGRVEFQKEEIDLVPIFKEALESFGSLAEDAGIQIGHRFPESLRIRGDRTRLTQVVMNMVNNAYKFTQPGGRIDLIAKQEGKKALVEVRDTGIGMTPEQMERLFVPFSQVHEAPQTADRPGTGLGLYISREIIALHGGNMWVKSPGRGKGASFYFDLALADGRD